MDTNISGMLKQVWLHKKYQGNYVLQFNGVKYESIDQLRCSNFSSYSIQAKVAFVITKQLKHINLVII